MRTLADHVFEPHLFQQRKHDLGDNYTQREINALDNMGLVEAISDGLEKRLQEHSVVRDAPTNLTYAARAAAFQDVMALIGARATLKEVADFCDAEYQAARAKKSREQWENDL